MSDLRAFRGLHAGADVIVCGCGQSLRELASPERFITIGVNDVGRLFDPTYLVVVNPRSQFKADRFHYVERSNARALFTQIDHGRVKPPVVRFRLGTFGGTSIQDGDTLHFTQNSPYVAVCLAAYMGARRIGLIGVDLTDDHFFGRTGRHPLSGRLREIDGQYGRLARALRSQGVELVNLSSVSRLSSLDRARIMDDGSWAEAPRLYPVDAGSHQPAPLPERTAMRVSIERRSGTGLVAQLLETLAATTARMGHTVVRDPRATAHDARTISIVWNGRGHRSRGPTLYCEHGWLPRSAYQISPAGINAASHLAPFAWDGAPLDAAAGAALDAQVAAIKSASFEGYYQYMQASKEVPEGLPRDFLLVPLQIEADTNIVHHAPPLLRTMQALVDLIARVNPPWPVIFKQHPADSRRGNRHLRLQMRRRHDLLWPQSRGNIHQLLQSGSCRGIITINSNVAHDGLLWDVPAIVLGRNIWPASGPRRPFLTAIPRDWSDLEASVRSADGIACRRAYASFLIANQWTLADARDPSRVAALLGGARLRQVSGKPPRVNVAARPAPRLPVINVVAANRGWLFEAWKRAFAAASHPGFEIVASNAPVRQAAAWIFIRAKEAAATPDPRRTVVQLHDLFDANSYRSGGTRACVSRCAGVSLTHPDQQEVLAAAGIDLGSRRWLLQPVGWGTAAASAQARGDKASIAWIGRPATHDGAEVTRLAWFAEAAAAIRRDARITLIGERLQTTAAAMRQKGIDCRVEGMEKCPPLRASEWIGRFDCVAVCGAADTGPWPLFDALNAGVPVVAAPAGWTARLLDDGTCGRIVDGPAAMADAMRDVLSARDEWRLKRPLIRERVAAYSLSAWIDANLSLAAELAREELVHEVA